MSKPGSQIFALKICSIEVYSNANIVVRELSLRGIGNKPTKKTEKGAEKSNTFVFFENNFFQSHLLQNKKNK